MIASLLIGTSTQLSGALFFDGELPSFSFFFILLLLSYYYYYYYFVQFHRHWAPAYRVCHFFFSFFSFLNRKLHSRTHDHESRGRQAGREIAICAVEARCGCCCVCVITRWRRRVSPVPVGWSVVVVIRSNQRAWLRRSEKKKKGKSNCSQRAKINSKSPSIERQRWKERDVYTQIRRQADVCARAGQGDGDDDQPMEEGLVKEKKGRKERKSWKECSVMTRQSGRRHHTPSSSSSRFLFFFFFYLFVFHPPACLPSF